MNKNLKPDYYKGNNGLTVNNFIKAFELNFALGNVIKYVARAGKKNGETKLEALKKAREYLEFEISDCKENVNANINKTVGSYQLFITDTYAYIGGLYVQKNFRNQGLATKTLLDLAQKFNNLYICSGNKRADRLYKRLGHKVEAQNCPKDLFFVFKKFKKWGGMYLIKGSDYYAIANKKDNEK